MYGFNLLVSKYVEEHEIKDDYVSYKIKVPSEIVDSMKVIDPGMLIAIIDTFSTMAGAHLFKGEDAPSKFSSVSMNLKINSFGDMVENENYFMKVFLKNDKDKLIFYDCLIFDKFNNLVKFATHLKKVIKYKF